jgi:hypothetical protein
LALAKAGPGAARWARGGDPIRLEQKQQNSQPMVAKWRRDSLTVIILLIRRCQSARKHIRKER